jgi:aspartate/methionine/tyrosine aminotransferase
MTAEQTKPVDPLYVYEVGSGNEPVILLHGLSKSFKYWEVRIIYICRSIGCPLRFNFAPSVLY